MCLATSERLELLRQRPHFRHKPRRQRDCADIDLGDVAFRQPDSAQQILGVQHTDDVLRLVTPERDAGVFGGEHLAHQLFCRKVRIDHHHFGAMNHDVGDVEIFQVEQAAEHVAILLLDTAFMMHQIDRTAQPLGRRQQILMRANRNAQQLHQEPHHHVDHGEKRAQDQQHPLHRPRDQKRDTVRCIDRHRLRQHLGEDDDQRRHHAGRIQHADLAEPCREHAGCERRRANVGEVIADQKRTDHALAMLKQPRDDAGLTAALHFQPHHARAGRTGQRGFARREKGGDHQTGNNDGEGKPAHARSVMFLRQFLAQEITHRCRINIVDDDGVAELFQKDEGELAALDLLVLEHQRQ